MFEEKYSPTREIVGAITRQIARRRPLCPHCINTPRLLLSNLIQSYQIPINYNQVPSKAALLAATPHPAQARTSMYGAVIHNYREMKMTRQSKDRQQREAEFLSTVISRVSRVEFLNFGIDIYNICLLALLLVGTFVKVREV